MSVFPDRAFQPLFAEHQTPWTNLPFKRRVLNNAVTPVPYAPRLHTSTGLHTYCLVRTGKSAGLRAAAGPTPLLGSCWPDVVRFLRRVNSIQVPEHGGNRRSPSEKE